MRLTKKSIRLFSQPHDYSQFITNFGLNEIDYEQLIRSYPQYLKKDRKGNVIADLMPL